MNDDRAELIVGAGRIDRFLLNADQLLQRYRQDTGCYYLDYQPVTPSFMVLPEDLAVTLLLNSQVNWRPFISLMEHGHEINLALLPQKPLEHTSQEERSVVADLITQLANLPGFAASVATKLLHKKRPDLIPILDNQAIFGAYMYPDWPEKLARSDSIKDRQTILAALNRIAFDVSRPENELVWSRLHAIEPNRTRIELFDSIWWIYFRLTQPVGKKIY